MHLRQLHVQNVKLLRDTKVSFTDAAGKPRMWTVFVGENRLCKTTLLQTIAAAAAGRDFGTQLVTDVVASWSDLRRAEPVEATIEATFGFSAERHAMRTYPGFEVSRDDPGREGAVSPAPGIQLRSRLDLQPHGRVLDGESSFVGWSPWFNDVDVPRPQDILTMARARELSLWFVAGYGPTRLLPSPGRAARTFDPMLDRLRPLFGESLIGTGFVDLLTPELGRAFAKLLDKVFVGGGILPHVNKLELRGRGGIRTAKDLAEAHRFEVATGTKGNSIRVPAGWLSQGYQSLIAWVADFVGHILLEAGDIESEEMEGLVLVDEIDLHLHPTWQVKLIPALKKVFPQLQFIATTHSPMVLPGLQAEEVWLLEQDEDGSVTARPSPRAPALLTGSELYGSFFDMNELYPNDLGEHAKRYGVLATDPTRTDAEDSELRVLRALLEKAGVTYDWEPVEREAAE